MVEADGQARHAPTDMPMKPQVVARELGKRLPRRRHRLLRLRHHHHLVGAAHSVRSAARCSRCSGNLAIDGRAACPTRSRRRSPIPDRQCVAFVGDGGFSMLMAEFATA